MFHADEIAGLCYERFNQLPRRGKPEPGREWTLLAAVVQLTRCADTVKKEVVSLGTGTKCIGRTAMSPKVSCVKNTDRFSSIRSGDVLNDSHAEVIARRGCIRYLIQELHGAVSAGDSSVFCRADQRGKWKLKPGVSFLFFTSHTPCGDASIIPMTDSESQPCPLVTSVKGDGGTDGALKRKAEEPSEGRNTKLPRLEEQEIHLDDPKQASSKTEAPSQSHYPETPDSVGLHPQSVPDIHRTGAKCVPGGPADPLHPGRQAGPLGGAGLPGALLSHYLEEVLYFSAVVVGKCPYNREAMHRALVTRCSQVSDLPAGFSPCPLEVFQSSLEFPFSQAQTELRHQAGQGRISPCGAAISWCNVTEQPLDVTANGYKHGVTRKALGTAKARWSRSNESSQRVARRNKTKGSLMICAIFKKAQTLNLKKITDGKKSQFVLLKHVDGEESDHFVIGGERGERDDDDDKHSDRKAEKRQRKIGDVTEFTFV
ncbi:tRNA-specific adenosine deaminase 1 [Collichthys lucidus]|uniref:tRNA-specific adenosine deaminase 1 n=1 Tax=Collichthys lucidus TaxID=240159 RepID=A0A4U5UG91_COLLU|nr:tRNA-specific adenosine deaminase 1 [Collichthys lucidus]